MGERVEGEQGAALDVRHAYTQRVPVVYEGVYSSGSRQLVRGSGHKGCMEVWGIRHSSSLPASL
jgi:hypothetical protein